MNLTSTVLLRAVVVFLILICGGITVYGKEAQEGAIRPEMKEHPLRFFLAFFLGSLLAAASALLPELIFPMAGICMILALLSDFHVGIYTAVMLNALPLLLVQKSYEYYLFGVATTVLFLFLLMRSNENVKIVEPLLIYALLYVTFYTALIVLKRQTVVPSLILNPSVGLLLNMVIGGLSAFIVRQNIVEEKDTVSAIVDPEFFLLLKLKGENKLEYKKSIHTAYLCDRMADRLGKNRLLLKGGGFYHRIGVLDPERGDLKEATLSLMEEAEFPEDLVELVREYHDTESEFISAEASILYLSDCVISEILKRFEEGEENINYNKMIDNMIGSMVSKPGGRLQKSGLSIHDLYLVRTYLKEEKLYYDFLR
ncbi:MAG: hypothetical protein K6F35_07545 [Lachnospiraceae bacterium]|nr:hypothetical protein [Lachnospiraceae bacterium]